MKRNARILHVIDRLAPGGAATALIETARHLTAAGQQHAIVSLEAPVAAVVARTGQAGIELVTEDAERRIAEADLLWVHGWTSPALDAFLRRPHPPARWLVWLHVAGDGAPHVLTPAMAGFPDLLVASSPYTASVRAFAEARAETAVVLAGSDLAPFAAVSRAPAPGAFRIGYVGTLDAAKMHPDFVAMSAAADIDGARFDLFGRGADEARLAREIAARGDGRFRLRGWVQDVAAAFGAMDAFGYPLARGSHATAELVVQEAMAAGLPPVLLDHGAAVDLVEHGRTGLIARDEADYPRCLEQLAVDPERCRAMGGAARRHALASFGADRAALAFEPLIARLLARPKTVRSWAGSEATGADRFLAALGDFSAPFHASRSGDAEADAGIAAAGPALASATSGGIVHWRLAYPDDPWLRFWSGLVHRGQGRRVPALGEFARARALGLASPRVDRYLAES